MDDQGATGVTSTTMECFHCNRRFPLKKQLEEHSVSAHPGMQIKAKDMIFNKLRVPDFLQLVTPPLKESVKTRTAPALQETLPQLKSAIISGQINLPGIYWCYNGAESTNAAPVAQLEEARAEEEARSSSDGEEISSSQSEGDTCNLCAKHIEPESLERFTDLDAKKKHAKVVHFLNFKQLQRRGNEEDSWTEEEVFQLCFGLEEQEQGQETDTSDGSEGVSQSQAVPQKVVPQKAKGKRKGRRKRQCVTLPEDRRKQAMQRQRSRTSVKKAKDSLRKHKHSHVVFKNKNGPWIRDRNIESREQAVSHLQLPYLRQRKTVRAYRDRSSSSSAHSSDDEGPRKVGRKSGGGNKEKTGTTPSTESPMGTVGDCTVELKNSDLIKVRVAEKNGTKLEKPQPKAKKSLHTSWKKRAADALKWAKIDETVESVVRKGRKIDETVEPVARKARKTIQKRPRNLPEENPSTSRRISGIKSEADMDHFLKELVFNRCTMCQQQIPRVGVREHVKDHMKRRQFCCIPCEAENRHVARDTETEVSRHVRYAHPQTEPVTGKGYRNAFERDGDGKEGEEERMYKKELEQLIEKCFPETE